MGIFYFSDEFYKSISGVQLTENTATKQRNKPCKLSNAEVITIMIGVNLGEYLYPVEDMP